MGKKRLLLLDTNIIIEAVRTGCWDGLRGQYDLVTVEKCREEAFSGIARTSGYVKVEKHHLESGIQIISVTDADRTRLVIACSDAVRLDDGERDLWAHVHSRKDEWEAVCADQAAVRFAVKMGWGDRIVSLEKLLSSAGIMPGIPLKSHYTETKLSIWRTTFLLEDY